MQCISANMYGCDTNDDCCLLPGQTSPLICQRNKPNDPLGTCVSVRPAACLLL